MVEMTRDDFNRLLPLGFTAYAVKKTGPMSLAQNKSECLRLTSSVGSYLFFIEKDGKPVNASIAVQALEKLNSERVIIHRCNCERCEALRNKSNKAAYAMSQYIESTIDIDQWSEI